MRKTFVLDTNVLLHDPLALTRFEDNHVVIPIEVVEEIDRFKRDPSEKGRNARQVSRLLDELRTKGNLADGVPLDEATGAELTNIAQVYQKSGTMQVSFKDTGVASVADFLPAVRTAGAAVADFFVSPGNR